MSFWSRTDSSEEVANEPPETQQVDYPTVLIDGIEQPVEVVPRLERHLNVVAKMMSKARRVALTSELDVRVGCVLADRNVIQVYASNVMKTHPYMKRISEKVYDEASHCMLHAEIAALVRLHRYANTAYVVRVGKDGSLLPSKPCPLCQCAFEENRTIKSVIFVDRNGRINSYRVRRNER